MKILHLAEKIYTGTACGACDKYEVCNDDIFIFSELFKRHRNNLSIIYFPTCFCSCPVQCSHVIHIAKKQACEVRTMTTWYIGRGLKYIHNTYTLKGRTFEGQIKPFEDPLKPFGFLRTV